MHKTLEEAKAARLDLIERINSIDVQLSERAARVSVGRIPDKEYRDYKEWKARALRSKSYMASKLARVKEEIQELRKASFQERLKARNGEHGMLRDLYGLTKLLVSAGADITPEEQQLLDDVQEYLE